MPLGHARTRQHVMTKNTQTRPFLTLMLLTWRAICSAARFEPGQGLNMPQDTAQQPTRYFYHELDESHSINVAQGYGHQLHAIACALLEGKELGRTTILPTVLKLKADHSFVGEHAKPLADVFNTSLLEAFAPIVFTENPNAYVRDMVMKKQMMELVVPLRIRAQSLGPYANVDIITRPHMGGYWSWFDACFINYNVPGDDNHLHGRWMEEGSKLLDTFRPVDSTLQLVYAIQQRLGEACTLHVRRGDKLREIADLDEATQPQNILQKIASKCPPGNKLYIASNENTPGFFDPLREQYELYTFRDFADILEPAGAVKTQEDGSVAIADNWILYQVEVEVLLDGSPFMDTFCVLYSGDKYLCSNEYWQGNNAGAYSMADNNGEHRAALGLLGGR